MDHPKDHSLFGLGLPAGLFIRENLIKMDDLGGFPHYFWKTPVIFSAISSATFSLPADWVGNSPKR